MSTRTQQSAKHKSARMTKPYDRTQDAISLVEIKPPQGIMGIDGQGWRVDRRQR